MIERRILPTLSVLFIVAAGGQLVSTLPDLFDDANASASADAAPVVSPEVAPEPIAAATDASSSEIASIAPQDTTMRRGTAKTVASTPDGIDIVREVDDASGGTDPALAAREDALDAQAERIASAAAELAKQQAAVSAEKARVSASKSAERAKLASLYAQMPTERAVAILSVLKPKEAALFIGDMPEADGARLLAALPPEHAVAVTRDLLGETDA